MTYAYLMELIRRLIIDAHQIHSIWACTGTATPSLHPEEVVEQGCDVVVMQEEASHLVTYHEREDG